MSSIALLTSARALLGESVKNLIRHQPLQAAAALSFYSLLSLAPLVIIVVAMAGLCFNDTEVRATLIMRIGELISGEAAILVETIIDNTRNEEENVFSLIVGGALMLVGATTSFAQLHGILNRIWNVKTTGRHTVLQMIKGRLWSFAFLIVIGVLLVASLMLSTLFAAFNDWMSGSGIDAAYWSRLDFGISYGLTTLLIAAIYKLLPDAAVAWRDALLGAVAGSLLFEASKFLVRYYVVQMNPESSFGAAGSVVVFMLWIYVAALIILVGAEISRASAIRRLSRKRIAA